MKTTNVAKSRDFFSSLRLLVYDITNKIYLKWSKKKYLLLSFVLPIVIGGLVYIALQMFPFGDRTILVLDMNGQYVYFFQQFRDILVGDQSLFYTFERSLGGEFFGYYTYYLASPLSPIVALFPEKMITEAIAIIMLLKSGLCGLTFAIYLDKTKKKNVVGFTMFSVMYALCAYATVYQSNTMWIDALIWLPLVSLGIESLVKEGKFKLFIISLALTIWSNYYIGYMCCIYVVLYFLFVIASNSNDEINKEGKSYYRLRCLGKIFISSIIAVLMAGAVIASAYYSLQFGKADLQDNSFAPDARMTFLQLISKLFIGTYDTVRFQGHPNIYSGTFALLMLPAYFLSKKFKGREKIAYTVLCLVFAISFTLNTIDLVWHGFQMPIWLNYRYSFMFSFLLLSMAYKGYENLEEVSCKKIGIFALGIVGILALVQQTVSLNKYNDDGELYSAQIPYLTTVLITIGFLLLYFILIYIKRRTNLPQTMSILLVFAICVEAFVGSLLSWSEEISDVGWASRSSYRNHVDNISTVVDQIQLRDPTLYRMEKVFLRKPNDNLSINIKGISEFTSTFNQSSLDFLSKLGIYTNSQTTKYLSSNELVDSLLGIKYVFDKDEDGIIDKPISNNYSYEYFENEQLIVYTNPYALPFAFAVDSKIKEATTEIDFHTPSEYGEYLMSLMMNEDCSDIYSSCSYIVKSGGCNIVKDEEGTSYYRNGSGQTSFSFRVTAMRDGNIYMFLPTLYNTPADCYVNGELLCTLFQSDTYTVQNIGSFKQGDTINVELSFNANRIYLLNGSSYFVQFNPERMSEITSALKSEGLNVSSYSSTEIIGTLNASSSKVVFTTIPYDSSWRAYVDGERVETYKCVDSMLGFDIEEGEHDIVLKYVPMQWYVGLIITAIGIASFIGLCIYDKKRRKKNIIIEETI